jgi:hypothetical protein
MAGLLAVGFMLNLLVRPLPSSGTAEVSGAGPVTTGAAPTNPPTSSAPSRAARTGLVPLLGLWLLVALPLGWGMLVTLRQAAALFR